VGTLRRSSSKKFSRITDHTGLVRNTKPWLDYWLAKYERLAVGQEDVRPGSIPLAAYRAARPLQRFFVGEIPTDNYSNGSFPGAGGRPAGIEIPRAVFSGPR
jgi:hypothetical protein